MEVSLRDVPLYTLRLYDQDKAQEGHSHYFSQLQPHEGVLISVIRE